MRTIKQIWEDIRKGENLDLYIAVPLAIIIALLNVLGIASSNFLTPITLAILGLIATALLGTRHAINNLSKKLSQSADTFFLDEYPAPFKSDLESATDLWIVGVSLTTPIRSYYSLFEAKLRKGHKIKVLLVDPESPAVELSEMRAYGRANTKRARSEIYNSLQDLCDLKKSSPQNIAIRVINQTLSSGIFGMDPDTTTGTLYLKYYSFKTPGGPKPKIALYSRDGKWYELFRMELHNLWDNGVEWQCKESRSQGPENSF